MQLTAAKCFAVLVQPANGGGVDEHFGAFQGCQSCRFGEPLVPANANANFSEASLRNLKAKITGRKIKLFIETGVIGNMHFAIFSGQ